MSKKEITMAEFVRRSGLTVSQVKRMLDKGEITSRPGYKHRYIPVDELMKVNKRKDS